MTRRRQKQRYVTALDLADRPVSDWRMAQQTEIFDVAVCGAGPAGLAAAIALAESGCRTALIDRRLSEGAQADTRTTALLGGSVTLLQNLGVWATCVIHGAPIRTIRIADATRRLLRAPTVSFYAADAGLDAFGLNVPNCHLTAALRARADACVLLSIIVCDGVNDVAALDDRAVLTLSGADAISAQLVVGADGRNSVCRRAAGIETTEHAYDQTALACAVEHTAPHTDVSTELHRESGPLTLVPLPDAHASGLVWVERPDEAARLAALDDTAFAAELESHVGGFAGRIVRCGQRSAFPLTRIAAHPIARRRTALVGEAAHVLPPIGAQGLNLGFRDVAALADIVGASIAIGEDPGGQRTLDAYIRARRDDIWTRSFAVDALNRSLLTDFLSAQMLRSAGLSAIASLPPLRRLVMRAGLGPRALPPLMRTEAGGRDM